MNNDRYQIEMSILNHSKATVENERKAAKIKGYICEAYYTHRLESSVRGLCFQNFKKIDSVDYASFLAVARSIGVPPYGEAGVKALEELQEDYDQTQNTIELLEEILDRKIIEQEKVDLYYINGKEYTSFTEQVNVSAEACVVKAVEGTFRLLSFISDEEMEEYIKCSRNMLGTV